MPRPRSSPRCCSYHRSFSPRRDATMDLAPLGALDLAPLSVLRFACCPVWATPPPACQKLHDEDSADVFSVEPVLVALIDALKRIGPGDHPVEVQLPVFVQVQNRGRSRSLAVSASLSLPMT